MSSLSRSCGSPEAVSPDRDDDDPDRQVDQEGQPPRHHGQGPAEHQAEHRADALHGCRHRHRPVTGGRRRRWWRSAPGPVGRPPPHRCPVRARPRSAAGTVGAPARRRQGRNGEDADPGQECPLAADGVADPPAEQQQAPKVSAYPVMIQLLAASDRSSSACIRGSATMAMVPSRVDINCMPVIATTPGRATWVKLRAAAESSRWLDPWRCSAWRQRQAIPGDPPHQRRRGRAFKASRIYPPIRRGRAASASIAS